MAHYRATIETPRPPEAVFAYLSDFSTTAEWDPGVLEAERIGELPVVMGTEFRLVASFLGRKSALTYRIIEFDPPKAVTLHGENSTVVSLDRIILEPHDGGTRLTYNANLALKGPLKIADPLLALAFNRVGARALAGLHKTLRARAPATPTTLTGHAAVGDRSELHEHRGSIVEHALHLPATAPPVRARTGRRLMRTLITGATGFIGGRLARLLREQGEDVHCLVRNANSDQARVLADEGFEIHIGDVLRPDTLVGVGEGIDVAYYLVHSMGRGNSHGADFAARERQAAADFARMAKQEGVNRIIYLGGLGDHPGSKHLRSRHATAQQLEAHGPSLTYFRAAMVVGSQSESYRTLRYLVERLPAMIAPAWLKIKTQPIGIDDVLSYLSQAPYIDASIGRELQIGGPDVLSYSEMLDVMAIALGKQPRPKIPVPFITPWLSSLWIGLVTPVDAGVAGPLIEGLSTQTIVTDHTASRFFDIKPAPFEATLRQAISEDERQRPYSPPSQEPPVQRAALLRRTARADG